MAKTVKLEYLGEAIVQELSLYHEDILERVDAAAATATDKLVKLTKATAPQGKRRSYRKHISSKQLRKDMTGSTYIWYVKAPDYRLTHLLVHGHPTKDGGRTKENPFLRKALDVVLPEYEAAVEEAIKK